MSEEATLDEFAESSDAGGSQERQETPIGELPMEWGVEWLKDEVKINPDGFPEDDWPSETFEYISLSEASGGKIEDSQTTSLEEAPNRAQRTVQQGDVLVGTVRPKQRSHGFTSEVHDGKICSSGFGVLRTEERLNSRYLLQEILSNRFFSQMEAYVAGSGYPAVKISDLKKHRIAIPPLPEQRKIATVLNTTDRAIEKTEEVITRFDRLFTGTRRSLLREGTNSDTSVQGTPTGRYPSNWELVRAGNFLQLRNGEYLAKKERTEDGDYPVYGGNGIMGHTEESIVGPETVVIGRVGAYCGNVHLTKEDAWVTDNAIILPELSDEYLPQFVVHLLNEIGLGQYSEQSAQPRISQSTVENLRIPKPSTDEQQEIVDSLSSITNAKDTEETYKNHLQRLKRGLMQDLLSGKVRTTDTNIAVPDEITQHG